jgi:SEC-C motif
MIIEDVRKYLASVRERPTEPAPQNVQEFLVIAKAEAVRRGDQEAAKVIWCLETALRIQNLYLQAFSEMKGQKFYKAWCDMERAEIALGSLQRHDTACWAEFRLGFIQKHIERWQSIFPYKLFYSPEFIALKKTCSICGKTVTPRKPCGHIKGQIYNGEECLLRVTQKVLGVSFVDKPLQKYSVVFVADPETGAPLDQYNYGIVQYAISALRSPFDAWDVQHTKRIQPHSRFSHVGRNDSCPCGSKKKYKKCCGPEEGVLCPHVEFHFEVAPPSGLPTEGLLAAL